MTIKLESRAIGGFELRKSEDKKTTSVKLVFPLRAISHPIWDLFYETFTEDAFDEDLANRDRIVAVDVNHDPYGVPLARSKGGEGTLKLRRKKDELIGEFDLPASRSDIAEAMERGDMDGTSIAFRPLDEDWNARHNGKPLRTVSRAEIRRMTLCFEPAYPDSSASKRSPILLANDLTREDYIELINKHMSSKPADNGQRALQNLIEMRLKLSKKPG